MNDNSRIMGTWHRSGMVHTDVTDGDRNQSSIKNRLYTFYNISIMKRSHGGGRFCSDSEKQ